MDYQMILDTLGDGVIVIDDKNSVLFVNKMACHILGKVEKDIKSHVIQDVFNICTKEKGSIILNLIKEVRLYKKTKGLDHNSYIVMEGQKEKYLSASISFIKEFNRNIIVITFRDITRIKKMESEAMDQRKNLETIFNSMPLGVFLIDIDRRILSVNPFIERNFDVEGKALQGVRVGELIKCSYALSGATCGEGIECENCMIKNTVESLYSQDLEYLSERIHKQHTIGNDVFERDYQVVFVKTYPVDRKRIILLMEDITEQVIYEETMKRARDEAQEASRLKSEFLSNMSHEIRTPLNGIIGMIELSKRRIKDPEAIENLEVARGSSLNLLQIINSVLDISKIEAGKFVLYEKPFDLSSLIKEVYNENRSKINKPVALIAPTHMDFERLVGDSLRIKQVINNLVDNAIKFTDEGSIIISANVFTRESRTWLKVFVKDSGIGIKEENLDKIFESFVQEDGSFTRQKGGTGLGLAISKKIIEKIGGEIYCLSNYGKGSEFGFVIPVKFEEDTKKTVLQNKESVNYLATNMSPLTILLAEDNIVNQKIIKEQFELDGHKVYIANDGKEAIEKFDEYEKIDLIIMDIQMPVMSGVDAADAIRKSEKGKDVPIIALTALALREERDKIMKHGFDCFIAKPAPYYVLVECIQKILYLKESKEHNQKEYGQGPKSFHYSELIKLYQNGDVSELEVELERRYRDNAENEDAEEKRLLFKLLMEVRKQNVDKIGALFDQIEQLSKSKIGEEYVENVDCGR